MQKWLGEKQRHREGKKKRLGVDASWFAFRAAGSGNEIESASRLQLKTHLCNASRRGCVNQIFLAVLWHLSHGFYVQTACFWWLACSSKPLMTQLWYLFEPCVLISCWKNTFLTFFFFKQYFSISKFYFVLPVPSKYMSRGLVIGNACLLRSATVLASRQCTL